MSKQEYKESPIEKLPRREKERLNLRMFGFFMKRIAEMRQDKKGNPYIYFQTEEDAEKLMNALRVDFSKAEYNKKEKILKTKAVVFHLVGKKLYFKKMFIEKKNEHKPMLVGRLEAAEPKEKIYGPKNLFSGGLRLKTYELSVPKKIFDQKTISLKSIKSNLSKKNIKEYVESTLKKKGYKKTKEGYVNEKKGVKIYRMEVREKEKLGRKAFDLKVTYSTRV